MKTTITQRFNAAGAADLAGYRDRRIANGRAAWINLSRCDLGAACGNGEAVVALFTSKRAAYKALHAAGFVQVGRGTVWSVPTAAGQEGGAA